MHPLPASGARPHRTGIPAVAQHPLDFEVLPAHWPRRLIATPCPRPHERRRRTLRFLLGHVIEQAANVPLTPDSVIQAVRVFAHLDPEGRWVNPPKQRRTNISFLIADPTRVGVPCGTGFSQRRKVLVLYTSLHISAGEVSRIRAGHLQPICPNPS
jgi:hypothetical protein